MKTASDARSEGRPTLLLASALLVSLHLIWQVWLVAAAPYPARYDYDEGVYAETAVAAAAGERLYATVFLSQPPLLIGAVAQTFHAFGRSLISARSVVVAFSVLWLAGLAAIAARGGRPRAALWAVAIAGSAPAFVVASHTVQMEGPSEALAALAVALGLAAGSPARIGSPARVGGWSDGVQWGAAGLAAGLAAMTKFTALTCLVPLAVIVAIPRERTAARAASLGAGALLGAAAAVAWTGSPLPEMWRQVAAFHGAVAHMTPVDPGRTAALFVDFAGANWFLVALGLAGLIGSTAAGRPATRAAGGPWACGAGQRCPDGGRWRGGVAAWLAADLVAIFLWRPVWAHHFTILVTPLAVLGAAAVEAVWRSAKGAAGAAPPAARNPAPRLAAGTLLVGWLVALSGTIAATIPETSAPLRAGAAQIGQAVPAGGWIVADDPIVPFLAGRDVPPALCDTSEMRMRAGWLAADALTAAVADPRVRGVVLWRGTFRRIFPAFVDRASKEFPRQWIGGNGRVILAR